MKRYYSQHGEDFLAEIILSAQMTGFFVEVGCIDGRRFSNTLLFEEKGWKGICIEAHSDYIPLLKANRPNSIIEIVLYQAKTEARSLFMPIPKEVLAPLIKAKKSFFVKKHEHYFSGFTEQVVPLRNLTSVFDQHRVSSIDLISIDIEGNELNALKGLDLTKYAPTLFIIECDTLKEEKAIFSILRSYNYVRFMRHYNNVLFVKRDYYRKHDLTKLYGKNYSIRLTHLQHPLDHNGDNVIECNIQIAGRSLLQRLFLYF